MLFGEYLKALKENLKNSVKKYFYLKKPLKVLGKKSLKKIENLCVINIFLVGNIKKLVNAGKTIIC